MFDNAFANKTVWLSGHTGFKGAWLTEWLLGLGARVHGYSLPAPTSSSLFEQLGLAERMEHELGDVCDQEQVRDSIEKASPDFVFHLAAQPLVREAYAHPVETFATNVQGTVHVLEALRELNRPCAAVFVTTDKCYENREWTYGYREEDSLGGSEPYGASKAAAELAIHAYRRAFFRGSSVRVASARAGNVIGGGDWAKDRIVPDCVRHLKRHQAIAVRNPDCTRPWQHVLEALSGYLWLAAILAGQGRSYLNGFSPDSAFNFGPGPEANRTVAELVGEVLKHWPGRWEDQRNPHVVAEAHFLQLCTDKARAQLKWSPVWLFEEAVARTVVWYHAAESLSEPAQVQGLTCSQIEAYCKQARSRKLSWAEERSSPQPVMTLQDCAV